MNEGVNSKTEAGGDIKSELYTLGFRQECKQRRLLFFLLPNAPDHDALEHEPEDNNPATNTLICT